MRITLKNFRCHKNKKFSIPDKGIILLSGPSGKGKTTLLNSIAYVLYGSIQRPYSYGTNTCEVTIEYKGAKITRSSKPNTLIVIYKETKYEDEAAQGMINKLFGMNFEEFMASSYVVQRNKNSVISMTPANQKVFIEKIAFSDDSHIIYKTKIIEKIKEYRLEISNLQGKISILTEQITKKESELPEIIPNIEDIKAEDIYQKRDSYNKSLEVSELKLKELTEEIKKIKKKEELDKEFLKTKQILEVEINQYKQLIGKLGDIKTNENIKLLEEKIETFEKQLNHTKGYLTWIKLNNKIKTFKEEYLNELSTQIKELEDKVISDEEYLSLRNRDKTVEARARLHQEETIKRESALLNRKKGNQQIKKIFGEIKKNYKTDTVQIKTVKLMLRFLNNKSQLHMAEISKIKNKIEELKENITEIKLQNKDYSCPKCKTKVKLHAHKLVLSSTKTNSKTQKELEAELSNEEIRLVSLKTQNDRFIGWINTLTDNFKLSKTVVTDITSDYSLEEANQTKSTLENYNNLKKEIQTKKELMKKLPSSISNLVQEANIQKTSFPKNFKLNDDLKTIEIKLNKLKKELDESLHKKSEYSKLSREIKNKEHKLNYIIKSIDKKRILPQQTPCKTLKDVEDERTKLHSEILKCSSQLSQLQNSLDILHNYENYKKDISNIDNLKNDLKNINVELTQKERQLQGALGLKEVAEEAEILAMEVTIKSINEYAKNYLKAFFKNPISIELSTHKITAKNIKKAKINTVVKYKDHTYNNINELSAGESQRCELAFLLGVNDMIGSNIILLDECMNNLDPETNMDVLTKIKDIVENKLVIVISHEAIKGIFDEVITI